MRSSVVCIQIKFNQHINIAELLRRTFELVRERSEEFATLISLEMGKPISQGEAEVEKSAWVCDYYADNAPKFLSNKKLRSNFRSFFIYFFLNFRGK